MTETPSLHNPITAHDAIIKPDIAPQIDLLRTEANIGDFFAAASNLARTIYYKPFTQELVDFRTEIEAGLDPEAVRAVVQNQDFSSVDPDPTDPLAPANAQYDRLLAVASLKTQIERALIREVVSKENQLGLSPAEKVVLLASCDIGDKIDLLYREWRGEVVGNPFLMRLSRMEPREKRQFLQQKGVVGENDNYLYAVLSERDGQIISRTYAQAFPEPVAEAGAVIVRMVESLRGMEGDDEAARLASYYEAFGRALTSTDYAQDANLWRKVDQTWMRVQGRMQPIHPMESYVDPNGLLVEPEYALGFRDTRDRAAAVNDRADITKARMIQWLEETFSDKNSLQASLAPMRSSLAGVYTMLVSGRRLDFRPAGQNIPNREGVRINDGVKIFLDMLTMDQRWIIQRKFLVQIFGEAKVAAIFDTEPDLVAMAAGGHVGGHEVAHNAFIELGTRDALGADQYQQVEEHKADAIIVAAAPEWLNLDEQRTFLKAIFAGEVRSIVLKRDESRRPYYNSAVFFMNHMAEAGIISFDDKEWQYDDSAEKVAAFFQGFRAAVQNELVPVYDERDSVAAGTYIQNRFQPSKLLEQLEETLGVK